MPIHTGGGKLHIEGGYNDIGRDLYHYRDNSSHNVLNPHNVSPPLADTGNRSPTGKRKPARVFRARRSAPLRIPRHRRGRSHQVKVDIQNEETLNVPLDSESRSPRLECEPSNDLKFKDCFGQMCEDTLIEEEVILEAACRILQRRRKLADEAQVQFAGNVFTPQVWRDPPLL